ncbi:MAG: antiterminator LoaP [Clostridia bacterium]|nr:antiterminator LoaP [Clostridia bacterium]
MNWYVLFVRTGQEHRVERFLKVRLEDDMYAPFVPLHEMFLKTSGVVKKVVKPLFPGYVFIESDAPCQELLERTNTFAYTLSDVVRILKYSDREFAMRESEKQMLLSLCNQDYCIESSGGIIEGDRIHIMHGPLRGRESIVRKIDRHKRKAWIEMEFMGDRRLVGVALEIVARVG